MTTSSLQNNLLFIIYTLSIYFPKLSNFLSINFPIRYLFRYFFKKYFTFNFLNDFGIILLHLTREIDRDTYISHNSRMKSSLIIDENQFMLMT